MSMLVADCPRCNAKEMTFDLKNQVLTGSSYGWQSKLEVFCVCRACFRPTIFLVAQLEPNFDKYIKDGLAKVDFAANKIVRVERYIGLRDNNAKKPPEYLPEEIKNVFNEGSACISIGCFNAAATMFRLCLDIATKSLLPKESDEPNNKIRRNLGLRLPWLFDNGILPIALKDLSTCIKDDGNDGAHEGILNKSDAEDILDFTFILLERLYTEPKRLEQAAERRSKRKNENI